MPSDSFERDGRKPEKRKVWYKDKLSADEIISSTLADERIAGKETPNQRPVAQSEPIEARPKVLPEKKNRPKIGGQQLLALFDEIRERQKTVRSARDVARSMPEVSWHLVDRLSRVPDFTEDMRKIISERNLGLYSALALNEIPPQLRTAVADACASEDQAITYDKLGGATYWVEKMGKSWKEALVSHGFTWPENFNDIGTLKT